MAAAMASISVHLLDGLHLAGGDHRHVPLEEQDALGQPFDVHHLLDGGLAEQRRQQVVALVVAVEVEVHVLVDGRSARPPPPGSAVQLFSMLARAGLMMVSSRIEKDFDRRCL
jgi:hypothetical protein